MTTNQTLETLSCKHPYYCSECNFYSNEATGEWATMSDFLEEFSDVDVDMNLIFRWDVKRNTDDDDDDDDDDTPIESYRAEVFIMHQRKGIFSPHLIERFDEKDVPGFVALVQKHWEIILEMWKPLV